jgi:thiol-disulfide isomerase/thioredoxin
MSGEWRGIIHTQGQELPFNFSMNFTEDGHLTVILKNGEEKIRIDNVSINGDSIIIPMHIFDADLVALYSKNELKGYWRKNYVKDYKIPFSASYGDTFRFFNQPQASNVQIGGRWEVYFKNASGEKLAIGQFRQKGQSVSGTFLRPSGDYRYLVGEIHGDQLFMSTFDGAHAYLFIATIDDQHITGDFYSGKTRHDTWRAIRNEDIVLPDPNSLTYLKEGYRAIDFKLPDMNDDPVSLKDPKFKDKVVIVQIFGTWCPNCMDETKFLSAWYNQNNDRGVEIIALAFEQKDDLQYAKGRIEKLKKRFNVQYDFLFGGKSDKTYTSKALPMLKGAVSFPTTIFIDRSGVVRKIHTGFTGPGTGEYYEQFVEDFNLFMDKLIQE